MNKFKEYHKYLLKESFLGFIYRRLILYPTIRLITGSTFLDVGCGAGIFLKYGSKKSLGLDINPFNIKRINEKTTSRAYLIREDGKFPIKSSSFHTVICDQVLEHIEEPSKIISEISRVTKKRGKIIVGLPMKKGFKADPDHKKYYDLEKIKKVISNNYEFKYKYHFYFPFPFKFAGKFFKWQYLYTIFVSTK